MNFSIPKGITVPRRDLLSEGYEIRSRPSGGFRILLNIDAERFADVVLALVRLVRDPGFLILESPCNEEKELQLRQSDDSPYHRDIYYLDGLSRQQFNRIFGQYSELLVHDGFINFGFGSHDPDHRDEVFVGNYKITTVFTGDPHPFEQEFARLSIPRHEKLTTAWETFSESQPGIRRSWSHGGSSIYDMIEKLMREEGLYHANVIED